MRIFWRFSDSDTATITASNTASGYKASNLQLNTLGKKWASDKVTATAELLMDFGSAINITSFAMLGHNLVPGSDTVTLKYADNAAITIGVVTISVTLTAVNWSEYFTQISKRYAQVVITKSLSTNQVSAGRLIHGKAYVPTRGISPGYQIGPGRTQTTTLRTRGGQLYANQGETLKALRGAFPSLPDTDRDELEELQNTNSTGTPFIVSLDHTNYPTEKMIYGTLDRVQPFRNVAVSDWDWSISMIEQK
jgi:hypothetical protein